MTNVKLCCPEVEEFNGFHVKWGPEIRSSRRSFLMKFSTGGVYDVHSDESITQQSVNSITNISKGTNEFSITKVATTTNNHRLTCCVRLLSCNTDNLILFENSKRILLNKSIIDNNQPKYKITNWTMRDRAGPFSFYSPIFWSYTTNKKPKQKHKKGNCHYTYSVGKIHVHGVSQNKWRRVYNTLDYSGRKEK